MASFVAHTPARYDWVLYAGRSVLQDWTITDAADAAVSLADVTAIAARIVDSRTGTSVLTLAAAIVVAASGTLRISATPADTAAYATARGTWECKLTFSDGVETTILRGEVTTLPEVVP